MTLRDKLRRREPVIGVLNPIASTDLAELLGTIGFDFVMFDMEHGSIDVPQLPDLARAVRSGGARSVPLVRVPGHDPKTIMRALDAGIGGTMVPQVNSATEAQAVAAAHRTPPRGTRSVVGATPAGRWGHYAMPDLARQQDESVVCIVQAETAAGVEAAAAIAAEPEVDAVLIGPFDLSVSLGHPGEPQHPAVEQAIRTVAAACDAAGRACGIYCTPVDAARYRELGMSLFLTGLPGLLRAAAVGHLDEWRAALR